jgi:hypothetical protein
VSASQLRTLGSALDNPVTAPGRILAVAMDVYAVVVIGAISGALAPTSRTESTYALKPPGGTARINRTMTTLRNLAQSNVITRQDGLDPIGVRMATVNLRGLFSPHLRSAGQRLPPG